MAFPIFCPNLQAIWTTCYGMYSNVHRGKIWKERDYSSHPSIIDDEVFFVSSRGWAKIIRKVYKVDPLIYPICGGSVRVIAFITDYSAVDRTIILLKFTFHAECPFLYPEFSNRNFCRS